MISPAQIGTIGETGGKTVGNVIEGIGNAKQLAQQKKALQEQQAYANEQFGAMGSSYNKAMTPYTQSGSDALNKLSNYDSTISSLDDMKGGRDAYEFQMDDFTTSPSYEFRKQEGIDSRNQNASIDGSIFSGGQDKELMAYGQDMASLEYDNEYDRKKDAFDTAQDDFTDARDYNTTLASNNMNRDLDITSALNNQGYKATTNNADTQLGISQDALATNLGFDSQLSDNTTNRTANKYGTMSNINKTATDGFSKFWGAK